MARESQWSGEIIPNGGLNDAVSPTSDAVSPNQWTAASNVEPMADGVRRRRGSAAASDTPTQEVAMQFRTGNDLREFVDATSEYIAQAFEPQVELYVDQLSVRLVASSGTPTGEVEIGIFTDNAGEPSGTAMQNAAFADYSTISAEDIQTADAKQTGGKPTWHVFKSSAGKATLAASTTYWIVCRHTGAAATGTSNISIQESTAGGGKAPGALDSASPAIWLDPDDIEAATGVTNNNPTGAATIPEHTGLHPGGWVPTGGAGVILHTAGGAENVNGHAWIEQSGTPTTLALSQGGSILSSYTFSGDFCVLSVYKPRVTGSDTQISWMIGRRSGSTNNAVGVPIRNALGRPNVYSDSDAEGVPGFSSDTQDTNDTDVKIMITNRQSGTFYFTGTIADNSKASFGTLAKSETIETDALFRSDNDDEVEEELGIVQLVVFDNNLSASDSVAIYNWAQNRFGLTYSSTVVGAVAYSTDGTNWTVVDEANLNYRAYSGVAEITAICDYQKSDGAQRHILVADQNVYKNVDGVVTMVDGQEKVPFQDSSNESLMGRIPSWSNGGDRLTITDYSTEAKKFYIDGDGIERWEWEGMFKSVVAPTFTPTAGAGGDAFIFASGPQTWHIDYHFYNNRTGARSNSRNLGVEQTGGIMQAALDGTDDYIVVTNIPVVPQQIGEGVTNVRFMIKTHLSSLYRLAKEVPIGTTSVTIDANDEPFTVEDEYNHNPPPVHAVRLYAENRNFIADLRGTSGITGQPAGDLALPWRLQWSAINGITPYLESYPALQYRDFDKSDRISALAFMPPRTLIVGMTRSIVALDARRPGVSDVLQLSTTVGVAHHRSIIVVDGVLYWLSDNPRGFYKWEPGMREPERMRGADKVLSELDQTRFVLASTARLPEDKDRSQLWTLLSSDGATSHDTVLVYDRALNAWTVFNKPIGRSGSVLGTVLESGVTKMYLGGADGIEREQDTGDNDDGANYTGSLSLKAFDLQQQGATKRLKGIQTIVVGSDDSDLAMELEVDLGNKNTQDASMDVSPSGGDRIVKTHEVRQRGHIFRPGYSGDKPWRIKDISFDIQPTKRTG